MQKRTVVDTGPIVAALIAADQHHPWACALWAQLEPPVFTCEAVLSEAQHIIRRLGGNPLPVLQLVRNGVLQIQFDCQKETARLIELQRTYADIPMSFADACLVRMTELRPDSRVMTTDSDFRIYRRNRRQIIPLLTPVI